MRPLLVIVLTVTVFGGMWALMAYHANNDPTAGFVQLVQARTDDYRLELWLSFAAGPDLFSLDETEQQGPPSVRVLLGGREIYHEQGDVDPGAPIVVEPVEGLVTGANALFVEAFPRSGTSALGALRLRLMRDGNIVEDRTWWAEPGLPVQGTVVVELNDE